VTNRFVNPIIKYTTSTLKTMPGAELYFTTTGTSTPRVTYQDFNGTTPHAHPVVALSDGHFPPIFLDGTYRAELKYLGVTQPGWPVDNIGATNAPAPLDDWNSAFSYSTGQLVTAANGNRYESQQDNNLNNEPSATPLYWSQIFLSGNVDTWQQLDIAARSGAGPKADAESAIRYSLDMPEPTAAAFVRGNADGSYVNRNYGETRQDLSIDNTNNTSDANKPISIAAQAALDALNLEVDNIPHVVSNYLALSATTGVVDRFVFLRCHTVVGYGSGYFIGVAGSVVDDGGMNVNSATAGVYWRRVVTNEVTIEMFGCVPGTTIDEVATLNGPFDKALAWANTTKQPLYASGTNYTLSKTSGRVLNWFSLHGMQMPTVKDDYSALENGTIFKGVLRVDCQYGSCSKLGVDHGSANYGTGDDALFIFSSTEDGEWGILRECVGLGRAPTDPFHALGIEGFINSDLIDCVGVRTYYGAAIKIRKGFIRNFRGYANTVAGIVIRSNLGNLVQDLIVDGVITVGVNNLGSGGGGTDYGVYIVADSQAQRIILNNLDCSSAAQTVSIRPNVNINDVIASNIITRDSGTHGFNVQIDAAAQVFSLQASNHEHLDCTAWGFYPGKAVSVQASSIYCSAVAASAYLMELIRFGPNVLSTVLNNIILSSNRSDTVLGAIRYDNANSTNALGEHKCYLSSSGTGYPSNTTVTQPSIAGATATLTPVYFSSGIHVMKVVHGGGAATVTTITTTPVAGALFPWGYKLIIFNDSATTLTLGIGGTGYLNKVAGVADIIQGSRGLELTFDGLNWIPTALS